MVALPHRTSTASRSVTREKSPEKIKKTEVFCPGPRPARSARYRVVGVGWPDPKPQRNERTPPAGRCSRRETARASQPAVWRWPAPAALWDQLWRWCRLLCSAAVVRGGRPEASGTVTRPAAALPIWQGIFYLAVPSARARAGTAVNVRRLLQPGSRGFSRAWRGPWRRPVDRAGSTSWASLARRAPWPTWIECEAEILEKKKKFYYGFCKFNIYSLLPMISALLSLGTKTMQTIKLLNCSCFRKNHLPRFLWPCGWTHCASLYQDKERSHWCDEWEAFGVSFVFLFFLLTNYFLLFFGSACC